MDSTEDEVQAFIERNRKEAEVIVTEKFPQKVKELDAFLHSDTFDLKRMSALKVETNIPVPSPVVSSKNAGTGEDTDGPISRKRKLEEVIGEVTGSKVFALTSGQVPVNRHLIEILDQLKPKIMELMDYTNMIKMWIQMNIPRIEDGNNFGVSIQEESLSEARQVESEAATFLEQISRYFTARGKLVVRLAKYPHVEDYRQAIVEIDEKEFITLRLVCCELRNQYAGLHDMIVKNIDKIKKPRNANHSSIY